MEVVRVDFHNGTQTNLLVARAPDSDVDDPFGDPVICGNLAAVGYGPRPHEHMVVDWRAQSYFILKNPEVGIFRLFNTALIRGVQTDSSVQITLIQNHMMLKISDGAEQIHIISNDALRAHLVPIVGVADDPAEFARVSPDDIPARSTFVDGDLEQHFNRMYVHESPLQDGKYRVWMHGTTNEGGLFRYQLHIPAQGHGEPRWGGRTRASETGSVWGYALPYSGHTFRYTEPGYTLFPSNSSAGRAHVNMPFAGDYFDIAPYSGTLTYSTHSSIVIQYYQ